MGAGGDGSRTLCARSPLAEEWARSIANCCSTPPLPIPCSKINQQELQIEKTFSGARANSTWIRDWRILSFGAKR